MGKRSANQADLSDNDPHKMTGNALGSRGTSTSVASSEATKRRVQFIQSLKALNQQFAGWISKQIKEKPLEMWDEGVKDYLDHAERVQSDFKDVVDSASMPPPSSNNSNGLPSSPNGSLSFPKPIAPLPTSSLTPFPSSTPPSLFPPTTTTTTASAVASMGNPFAPTTSTSTSTSSGGNTLSSISPFGSMGATATPSSSGPSLLFGGGGGGSSTPLGNPFSPGLLTGGGGGGGLAFASPLPQPVGVGGGGNADDDDCEAPPSPTKVARSSEEQILMECKAKMFFKMAEWKDMGVGQLTLRKGTDSNGDPLPVRVVMCNTVGKFTMNASLYPGLKVQSVAKQPKQMIVTLFNAEAKTDEGKKEATLTMLRFGKQETAEEFKSKVEANIPTK